MRHAYVIVVTYIVFKFPKLANTLSGKKVMAFEEKFLNFEIEDKKISPEITILQLNFLFLE